MDCLGRGVFSNSVKAAKERKGLTTDGENIALRHDHLVPGGVLRTGGVPSPIRRWLKHVTSPDSAGYTRRTHETNASYCDEGGKPRSAMRR